jgi:hypothetical protein
MNGKGKNATQIVEQRYDPAVSCEKDLMPGSVLDCDKLFIDVGWEFDPLCPMD